MDNRINKEKIEYFIEVLQSFVEYMEDENIAEVVLKPNTYGMSSDFIGVCGAGYLPLYHYALEDLELEYADEEYEDEDENETEEDD